MDFVTIEDLKPYPYLVFEQGERNSFYFSEEFLSVLDFPKIYRCVTGLLYLILQ